jgi:RES domain-containing protein
VRLWRIAGASHQVWSGEGARIYGARWNPPGVPAIYAGTSYAIAMLETLVHANMSVPPVRLRYVWADVGDEAVERAEIGAITGWNGADGAAARAYGGAWLRERRSLVLLVPSVVTVGLDWNAVINPMHPLFSSIVVSSETPVAWDERLRNAGGFGGAGTAPPTLPA